MTDHANTPEPTDAEIDDMLGRTVMLASAALVDHPQRERALEILAAGGRIFAHRDDNGRVSLRIGWFDDPRLRPPDADPAEVVRLLTVPRRVLLAGANGRGDS